MEEKIIGIMGAMPEEITAIAELLTERKSCTMGMRTYHEGKLMGIKTVVVFSRWGKVAAAATITNLMLHFKITELIFTGVAGAIHPSLKIGDVVIAQRLFQHDMDARPLMQEFEIPLLGVSFFESASSQINRAARAVNELFEKRNVEKIFYKKELEVFGIDLPKCIIADIASGDKFFSKIADKISLSKKLPTVACVEMEGAAVAQVCYEYAIPFIVIRTISDTADEHSPIDFPAFIKEIASKYQLEIIKNIYQQYES